jgi:hypothetical protein
MWRSVEEHFRALAQRYLPDDPRPLFHAKDIFHGSGNWKVSGRKMAKRTTLASAGGVGRNSAKARFANHIWSHQSRSAQTKSIEGSAKATESDVRLPVMLMHL